LNAVAQGQSGFALPVTGLMQRACWVSKEPVEPIHREQNGLKRQEYCPTNDERFFSQ
jgi:hypothetical protein